jgi:hypothetical protein
MYVCACVSLCVCAHIMWCTVCAVVSTRVTSGFEFAQVSLLSFIMDFMFCHQMFQAYVCSIEYISSTGPESRITDIRSSGKN